MEAMNTNRSRGTEEKIMGGYNEIPDVTGGRRTWAARRYVKDLLLNTIPKIRKW
jgi:hypothetical protein